MKYLEIPMHLLGYREGDYEPKLYAYLLDPIKDYRPAPRPAIPLTGRPSRWRSIFWRRASPPLCCATAWLR